MLEINRRTPLFVHDAHFDRVPGQTEDVLNAGKQLVGEGHLIGSMHLWLDDINRAGSAVAPSLSAGEITQRDQRCHSGIQDALRDLSAGGVDDSICIHVMADVTDEHQTPAWQPQFAAIGCYERFVTVKPTFEGFSTFLET